MAEAIDTTVQERVKEAAVADATEFKDFAKTQSGKLQEDVGKIVDKYTDPETYKSIVEDIINNAWTTITTAYATLSTTVANIMTSVTNQIAAIGAVFTGIGSGIAGLAAQISSLNDVINLVQWVIDMVTFIVDTIANIVTEILETIEFVTQTVTNVGVKLLKDASTAVTAAVTAAIEAPAALIDTHLTKVQDKANETISKASNAETLTELTTGRKPGEEDFVTSIEAFGGKLTEDQDKHGIKIPKPTDVGIIIGG